MSELVQLMLPPKSWAGEEWLKRHEPVFEANFRNHFQRGIVGYRKKPDAPLPHWWGKPNILIKGISV